MKQIDCTQEKGFDVVHRQDFTWSSTNLAVLSHWALATMANTRWNVYQGCICARKNICPSSGKVPMSLCLCEGYMHGMSVKKTISIIGTTYSNYPRQHKTNCALDENPLSKISLTFALLFKSRCDCNNKRWSWFYGASSHSFYIMLSYWPTKLQSEAGKSLSPARIQQPLDGEQAVNTWGWWGRRKKKQKKTATETAKCKMNRDTWPDFRPEQQRSSHVASTSGTDDTHVISKGESWILTSSNACCSHPC